MDTGGRNAVSVGGKEDYGLGVTAYGRNNRIIDKVYGIRYARIFRKAVVGIIGYSRFGIYNDVFNNGAVTYSSVNLRLFFTAQVDAFCIAAALDIEYSLIRPAVLRRRR